MTVHIKGKDIELKYTIRALMMYENMVDNTFNPQGVTDMVTFFYCIVLASSKDYSITFDEFIDYIDESNYVLNDFKEWINKVIESNNILKKN